MGIDIYANLMLGVEFLDVDGNFPENEKILRELYEKPDITIYANEIDVIEYREFDIWELINAFEEGLEILFPNFEVTIDTAGYSEYPSFIIGIKKEETITEIVKKINYIPLADQDYENFYELKQILKELGFTWEKEGLLLYPYFSF